MPTQQSLCGWRKDTKRDLDEFHSSKFCYEFDSAWRHATAKYTKKEVVLMDGLMELVPDWKNSRQAIGDCVSHGGAHCVDLIMSTADLVENLEFEDICATEPLYGLCRVEALGKTRGSWGDGATATGQMRALRDYGAILRQDYSKETGNSEHDLRVYSGKKAKSWGYYGCGGQDDGGKMDTIARRMPVKSVVYVKTLEQAAALIENGYPLSVCSGYGFNTRRDENGMGHRRGSWAHCMCFAGVRWFNDEIQLLLWNSWGTCASGPHPGIKYDGIKSCTWWISARDAQGMINARGTYGFSDIEGLKLRKIDFSKLSRSRLR